MFQKLATGASYTELSNNFAGNHPFIHCIRIERKASEVYRWLHHFHTAKTHVTCDRKYIVSNAVSGHAAPQETVDFTTRQRNSVKETHESSGMRLVAVCVN